MSKQSVTLSLESEAWRLFQKHCIDNSTKPSRLIQRFIENTIGRNGQKRKKPRLTAQQEARMLLKKLLEAGPSGEEMGD